MTSNMISFCLFCVVNCVLFFSHVIQGLQNSRQSKLSSRVIHLQVEQTTERMKKWGGQDISTDKVNDSNIWDELLEEQQYCQYSFWHLFGFISPDSAGSKLVCTEYCHKLTWIRGFVWRDFYMEAIPIRDKKISK